MRADRVRWYEPSMAARRRSSSVMSFSNPMSPSVSRSYHVLRSWDLLIHLTSYENFLPSLRRAMTFSTTRFSLMRLPSSSSYTTSMGFFIFFSSSSVIFTVDLFRASLSSPPW